MIPSPTYTPGFSRCKMLFIAGGIALATLGFIHIQEPLYLVLCGKHIQAEACAVVKTKQGLPDKILIHERQVLSEFEPRDRSYLFWNEFRFQTDSGKTIQVRAPIASRLKPLYPLTDADGLPTTDLVCYNPRDPHRVTFPLIVSTWFASGILIGIGLLAMGVGTTLLYWSKVPIELPPVPTGS
ncbi:MAG: hypothetical protein B9S32_14730 [Verrucomicrobia bacterium Tous-C9LFEB]|nr:MAG: hypothetical protein B9S32_14730 [Verrucomicrobia bacterium Tous-C9LFEB]